MNEMSVAIHTLRSTYPSLPDSYFRFLAASNGIEGEFGIDPGWVVIWSAGEALTASNVYQLPECLPGFFAFGGNGGGELFVMSNECTTGKCPVWMVPCIGMALDELIHISPSFEEFESNIGAPFIDQN